MKTKQILPWLMMFFIGMVSSPVLAQSYDQLWKEVETYQKKDLPKSVMATAGKIYEKAKKECNLPQMMKAQLVRSSSQVSLTPDSADAEFKVLKAWAERETDTVARAVLNSLMGTMTQGRKVYTTEEVIRYFRLSVENKDILGHTSAKMFRPMTESGKRSEAYFDDNMLDLLTRRAIQGLVSTGLYAEDRMVKAEACLDFYDGLIGFYEKEQNRPAALLTKVAKLWFQKVRLDDFKPYRLSDEEIIEGLRKLIETYSDVSWVMCIGQKEIS